MNNRRPDRANDQRLYIKRSIPFLQFHPICPIALYFTGARVRTDQIHHAKRNVGALLLDERFWLGVSSLGHQMAEQIHVKECRMMGFNLTRGYCLNDELEHRVITMRRNLDFRPVPEYDELMKAVYPQFYEQTKG